MNHEVEINPAAIRDAVVGHALSEDSQQREALVREINTLLSKRWPEYVIAFRTIFAHESPTEPWPNIRVRLEFWRRTAAFSTPALETLLRLLRTWEQ